MNNCQSKILTIIIPVYNVEKFIKQCIESVIVPSSQMDKLEIIIVNDGTPDNSADIARAYTTKFPRTIKVIDKENGGHGSAWNVGLKMATGKYTRFLDSDDWLSNLSEFINCLEGIDSDLVFTHLNKYYENTCKSGISKIRGVSYNNILSTSSFSYLESGNDYYIYDFWYCTYKTEMLQKEQPLFVERVSYDDAILFLAPLILGESMVFLDLVLYNYRLGQVGQSVNQKVELKRADSYVKVSKSLIDFANKHQNINDNKKAQRNAILSKWMKNRCSLFSCLPYKDYKRIMNDWFPYINKDSFINLSPKLKLYKILPNYISWAVFQIINKIIIKFS